MPNQPNHRRQGLVARLNALQAALDVMERVGLPARDSIRRIARSLIGSEEDENTEVAERAAAVRHASTEDIEELARELLAALRAAIDVTAAGRTGILIVEPDTTSANQLRDLLENDTREVRVVSDEYDAEEALRSGSYSLVLIDLVLPDGDGRNLLIRLRKRPETATVPILMIADRVDRQTKAECFALGADDFFEKPLAPETVTTAVDAKLARAARLASDATRDGLTGLSNQASLREAFSRAEAMAARGMLVSMAMLDVDHLGQINDEHGELIGDQVLRHLAMMITGCLRRTDLVARWSGEEFIILFVNTARDDALRCTERILETVRGAEFRTRSGEALQASLSGGLVEVSGRESLEDVVERAARLLSRAKEQGRDRVVATEGDEREMRSMLLAEPDALTVKVITERLGGQGFQIVHDSDIDALVKAAETTAFSLVICDVGEEDFDGAELIRRLRALPNHESTPIIMITAMGNSAAVVQGFELGANDYVIKPFSPAELSARVHRMLRKFS